MVMALNGLIGFQPNFMQANIWQVQLKVYEKPLLA